MEQFTKTYRMKKRTATQIKLMGVLNEMTAGQTMDALCKLQGASKYLRNPAEKALFERVWGQCVLSAQRAGKSGFKAMPDPNNIDVEIK